MSELESVLNYLETTSMEPHDDYTSEFSYKEQKVLWKYIKELQQKNQKYKEVFDKVEEYIKKRINSCTAEANSTTNDTMCRITIVGLKHLLDILKEVK